ncbi:MAG: hypothetical protein K0U54_10925 [Bacteroidetes bacterium]|nr:hypothetical protein [Bacteroidota bacterium]
MLLIGSVETSAQDSDLARIEYTYIPQTDSENSISRFRGLINFPIRLNWDGSYLVAGFEYRNLDLDFEDPVPFSVDELGKFQLFRTTLAYTFKLKNDWRFAAKVGAEANSNFETGKITNDDTNFTGALFLIKSRSGDTVAKPSRLILGLNYTTNAGRPFPIPIVNYYKKFHPNWSYSVGTPKTNLKHFWKKKHSVQAYVTVDGFFSNIQNNLEVPLQNGSATAENISMTMIFGGLGYEYFFSKHLLFYAYGGYSFYNEIRLRDEKRNSLFKINERNTYYLRTGIKFKI